MGHKVGWLTLYAGIAGGADIILLPEIPYDINKVIGAINKRTKAGKGFTILAVAEGAISKEDSIPDKESIQGKSRPTANIRPFPMRLRIRFMKQQALRSVLRFRDIHSGAEAHVHMTECSVPDLALQQHRQSFEEDYGCMIAMINGETKRVPLAEVSGKFENRLIRTAR